MSHPASPPRRSTPRVLSIQSHVVSGYVGNRAATFPLQLLGYEVDVLNTVQLSNHTGYGRWTGDRYTPAQILSLFDGLETNGLTTGYTHLLTGYLGHPGNGEVVADVLGRLRAVNPELRFVLDPVMGDQGHLYVPPEMVALYRDKLGPLASVITPNGFEAQLLSSSPTPLTTLPALARAISRIHDIGVTHVVVTSVELEHDPGLWSSSASGNGPWLYLVGSTRTRTGGSGRDAVFAMRFPKVDAYFSGTGDLFAALVCARMEFGQVAGEGDGDEAGAAGAAAFKRACELALATTQGVLTVTAQRYAESEPTVSTSNNKGSGARDAAVRSARMRCAELRLVECRDVIEQPEVVYRAVDVGADLVPE